MPIAAAKLRYIGPTRVMTREDMAATFAPAFKQATIITAEKVRDSHHRIARLAATGMRKFEIAKLCKYSYNRVHVLLQSPAMLELVERYRGKVDEAYERNVDEFYETATSNMMQAERLIAERLEDSGDSIAVKDLLAISRDAADRFGYDKKQTKINANTDFAAELEKAIQRSGKAIDVTPNKPAEAVLRRA